MPASTDGAKQQLSPAGIALPQVVGTPVSKAPEDTDKSIGIFLSALSLALIVAMLVPFSVGDPGVSLDHSWEVAVYDAIARKLQFGTEFIFTMGPMAFIYGSTRHPETYLPQVLCWCVIAIAWWYELQTFTAKFVTSTAWRFALAITLTIYAFGPDIFFYSFLLLGFLNREIGAAPKNKWLSMLWPVALGFYGLAKFSFLASGLVVLGLGTALRLKQLKESLVFGATLAIGWFAFGQSVHNIVPYLMNSLEVASGYSLAMSSDWLRNGTVAAACFALPALSTVLLAACIRKEPIIVQLRILLIQILCAYIIHKAAIVRLDCHLYIASQVWPFESALLYLVAKNLVQNRRLADLAALTIGIQLGIAMLVHVELPFGNTPLLFTRPNHIAGNALALGRERASLADMKWGIRANLRIPKIEGTVDCFPDFAAAAFAAGNYAPRPVPQAYCSYTSKLQTINAEHLVSNKAPQYMLFEMFALDNRVPTLADAKCWLPLIANYTPAKQFSRFTLLKQSDKKRGWRLDPIVTLDGAYGKPISLPFGKDELIWMELESDLTRNGTILSTLFHVLPPNMDVSYADGTYKSFVVPVNMAKAGFIISPIPKDNVEAFTLFTTKKAGSIPKSQIRGFVMQERDNKMPFKVYKDKYRVKLYKVVLDAN